MRNSGAHPYFGLLLLILIVFVSSCKDSKPKVLVFSKTQGWHHESIPDGIRCIQELGKENNFIVDTTTDATLFTEQKLTEYSAVIFLNTTGNVLNPDQQVAFERYIQAGGGFAGIHSAADTEYEWAWYNKLVGAYFESHPNDPNVRKAVIDVLDDKHISTSHLPKRWERSDEWYNYKSMSASVKVLAKLDEETYDGGENGDDHNIAWYQEFDGGRAFYTGGGHTSEAYLEPLFRQHLLGGIKYVIGENTKLDFKKSYASKTPDENRFRKVILANDLNEPMEVAIADDGRAFFIERQGNFYQYHPGTKTITLIRKFPVLPDTKEGFGNGLLGITLDPKFLENNFIYFFYTPVREPASQYVSRFILKDDKLDSASEKVIIQIPIELEVSAHTGGSMAWDKKGNLYISTGDNTVPFASDGFAPIDEREGRITFDAQRSASNSNDLRGKILRIHPEEDGTYTVPEGNLFPKGTPGTKPEIYIMGCRNPYRISVDPETTTLYWGEIGPDSGKDGLQGPRGYDEINQAKGPGNYGWPYFVGDNIPYKDFDFATSKAGIEFDSKKPINESPNNTGIKELPPTQTPLIWYPYNQFEKFPTLGLGGRSAMAGPVYHFNEKVQSKFKLPEYYDNAFFVFDWMRNWIFATRFDEQLKLMRLEPFMPVEGDFRRPIDIEIGKDGVMYILEYGSVYGIDNVDARLVRLEYNQGNRAPGSFISVNDSVGHAPLKVNFSGRASVDPDEDKLSYEWFVDGKKLSGVQISHTFDSVGVYPVVLTVRDGEGLSSSDSLIVKVGNTYPDVSIKTEDNLTFFFPDGFNYEIEVKDKEDEKIDPSKLVVTLDYIADANPLKTGHQSLSSFNPGKSFLEGSDCKACHQYNAKSVGPSFNEISKRYQNDKTALKRLSEKIIAGGGGVWGDHAMNAHPQLSVNDTREIVSYILSLQNTTKVKSLPAQGNLVFAQHKPENVYARYVLKASYTDSNPNIPLRAQADLILRPSRIEAEYFDKKTELWNGGDHLSGIGKKSILQIRNIDLKDIKTVTYHYSSSVEGTIELRRGFLRGPVVSSIAISPTSNGFVSATAMVTAQDTPGKFNYYIVFNRKDQSNEGFASLDWVEFKK